MDDDDEDDGDGNGHAHSVGNILFPLQRCTSESEHPGAVWPFATRASAVFASVKLSNVTDVQSRTQTLVLASFEPSHEDEG